MVRKHFEHQQMFSLSSFYADYPPYDGDDRARYRENWHANFEAELMTNYARQCSKDSRIAEHSQQRRSA